MTLALNTSTPQKLSFAQIESVWIQAGGNPAKAPMAAAVALAESGGWTSGPNATNYNSGGSAPGSTDIGLWQINNYYHPAQATYDVTQNAKGAILISNNGQNWRPWCSAWSNNDCSGVFMGAGSNALAHLQDNIGVAPASQFQLVSDQQPNNAAGGGNSPAQSGSSGGDTCAWKINFPLFGSSCIFSKVFVRQVVGGALITSGVIVGILGIAVIAVYTFNKNVGGPIGKSAAAIGSALVPKGA